MNEASDADSRLVSMEKENKRFVKKGAISRHWVLAAQVQHTPGGGQSHQRIWKPAGQLINFSKNQLLQKKSDNAKHPERIRRIRVTNLIWCCRCWYSPHCRGMRDAFRQTSRPTVQVEPPLRLSAIQVPRPVWSFFWPGHGYRRTFFTKTKKHTESNNTRTTHSHTLTRYKQIHTHWGTQHGRNIHKDDSETKLHIERKVLSASSKLPLQTLLVAWRVSVDSASAIEYESYDLYETD